MLKRKDAIELVETAKIETGDALATVTDALTKLRATEALPSQELMTALSRAKADLDGAFDYLETALDVLGVNDDS